MSNKIRLPWMVTNDGLKKVGIMNKIKEEIKLAFEELGKYPELQERIKKILAFHKRPDVKFPDKTPPFLSEEESRKVLGLLITIFLTVPNIQTYKAPTLQKLGKYLAEHPALSAEEGKTTIKRKNR